MLLKTQPLMHDAKFPRPGGQCQQHAHTQRAGLLHAITCMTKSLLGCTELRARLRVIGQLCTTACTKAITRHNWQIATQSKGACPTTTQAHPNLMLYSLHVHMLWILKQTNSKCTCNCWHKAVLAVHKCYHRLQLIRTHAGNA